MNLHDEMRPSAQSMFSEEFPGVATALSNNLSNKAKFHITPPELEPGHLIQGSQVKKNKQESRKEWHRRSQVIQDPVSSQKLGLDNQIDFTNLVHLDKSAERSSYKEAPKKPSVTFKTDSFQESQE